MDITTYLPYILESDLLTMWLLIVPALVFLATFALFVLTAKLVSKYKDTKAEPLIWPIVIVFVALDWFANWYVMSLWFFEWPQTKSELVTDRMKRYKIEEPSGSRKSQFAFWLCKQLSEHDEGHC